MSIVNEELKNANLEQKYIENFAEILHKIWGNWYRYQRDNSTNENISRWNKQSETEYKNLSEEDKEKDRKIYRENFIEIIK